MVPDFDLPLQFYCECSGENCTQRNQLGSDQYDQIHRHRDRFGVATGHETGVIEKVIHTESGYSIVEKFDTPPEDVAKLQPTNVDSS